MNSLSSFGKLIGNKDAELLISSPTPLNKPFSQLLNYLFTDIIGSSLIYKEKGSEEGLALAVAKFEFAKEAKNQLVNPEVMAFVKTMGDAIMAISYCPAALVKFVCELNTKIVDFNKQRTIEEPNLYCRFTAHSGPCLIYKPALSKTNDCFGETINFTARLEGSNKKITKRKLTEGHAVNFPFLVSDEFFLEIFKNTDAIATNEIEACLQRFEEVQIDEIREHEGKKFKGHFCILDSL
jgi:hypothetical protein